jgi:hypothetical protein
LSLPDETGGDVTRAKRWWVLVGLLSGLMLAPRSAQAQHFELGVGADFWTAGSGAGLFTFTFDALWTVTQGVQLGLRPGFLLTTADDSRAGIPVDFQIRGIFHSVYVDGFAGPWFMFKGDVVRAHIGMGAGIRSGRVHFGGEVSYLTSGATFGARLAFEL